MKDRQSTQTLGDYAYKAIAKYFKKSVEYEAEVLEDKDPEAVHKMRVGMRRLRSILEILGVVLDVPKAAGINQIRKIAHTLGNLRDLDVQQANLKDIYYPELPDSEQKQVKSILEQLHKKRQKTPNKMAEMLEEKDYKHFKQSYKEWLEAPKYTAIATIPIHTALPDLLLPLISQLLLHPGWLVDRQIVDQDLQLLNVNDLEKHYEVLHSLRKLVKAARYQTEFFSEFYGIEYASQVRNFETIQELLGKIQDSFVLLNLLTCILNKDVEKALPNLFKIIQKQQSTAWQDFCLIQKSYLEPEFRHTLRSLVLSPQLKLPTQENNHS